MRPFSPNHDTKFFAAVLLDGEVLDTALEGLDPKPVLDEINYFIRTVLGVEEDKQQGSATPILNGETLDFNRKKMLDILSKLDFLLDMEKVFREKPTGIDTSEWAKHIAKKIQEKLNQAKDVFLLGGWLNLEGGHQMIYRLFYNKQGNLVFLAYNTGAGLQRHKIRALANEELEKNYKKKYNPAFAIEFKDKKRLNDFGGIVTWISRLIEPCISSLYPPDSQQNRTFDNNEAGVYETRFLEASYLGGSVVDPERYVPYFISGQRGGTCVPKSVEQVLRSCFKMHEDYRYFFLHYRLYLLEKFIKEHPSHFCETRYDWKLLNRAVENTAYMLDNSKTLSSFLAKKKPDVKKHLVARIDNIQKAYQNLPIAKNKSLLKVSTHSPKVQGTPAKMALDNDSIFWKNPSMMSMGMEKSMPKKNLVLSQNCDVALQQITDAFSLVDKSAEALSLQEASDFSFYTEKLCFKFVGENALFNHLQPQEIARVIEHLVRVTAKYYLLPTSIDTPRGSAINFALGALVQCALRAYEEKTFTKKTALGNFTSNNALIASLLAYQLHHIISKTAFLASTDSDIQALWFKLFRFYPSECAELYKKCLYERGKVNAHQAQALLDDSVKNYLQIFSYYPEEEKTLNAYFEELIKASSKTLTEKQINGLRKEGLTAVYAYEKLRPGVRRSYFINNYPLQPNEKLEQLVPNVHQLFSLYDMALVQISICSNGWRGAGGALDPIHVNWSNPTPSIETALDNLIKSADHWFTELSNISSNKRMFTHYYLENCLIHAAISQYNSNQIQLKKPGLYFLSEEVLQHILHIRNAPALQVTQSLSYFTDHWDLLDDKNYRMVLLLNLFQPGVLFQAVRLGSSLLLAMESLVTEVLRAENILHAKSLSERSLFVLKLATFFYGFLSLESKEIPESIQYMAKEKLVLLQEKYSGYCSKNAPLEVQTELNRLRFIYQMYAMNAQKLWEDKSKEQALQEVIYLRIAMQSFPRMLTLIDPYEEEGVHAFCMQIRDLSLTYPEKTIETLKAVLERFDTLKSRGPFTYHQADNPMNADYYAFRDVHDDLITVDLKNGTLYDNGSQIVLIESSFTESAEYQEVFGNTPCLASHNLTGNYEWMHEGDHYRLIGKLPTCGLVLISKTENKEIGALLQQISDFPVYILCEDRGVYYLTKKDKRKLTENNLLTNKSETLKALMQKFQCNIEKLTPAEQDDIINCTGIFPPGHKGNFGGLLKKIDGQWFLLAAMCPTAKSILQFQHSAFSDLPAYLNAKNYRAWIQEETNTPERFIYIEDISTKKKVYVYNIRSKELQFISDQTRVLLSDERIPPLLKPFSRFEDPAFIEVRESGSVNEGTSTLTIDLPRYNVQGALDKNQGILLNGHYRLLSEKSFLGTGMIVEDLQSTTKTRYLWIPIQHCFREDESLGLSHPFVHNLSSTLNFCDTGSEKYACFIYDAQQPLIPQRKAHILYLSYLYCARYDYHKAHQLLNEYSPTGTIEELTYLYWVCTHLCTRNSNTPVVNSNLIAIQLKALLMIASIYRKVSGLATADDNLQLFIKKDFSISLQNKYEQYLNRENNIDTQFCLSTQQKLLVAYELQFDYREQEQKAIDDHLLAIEKREDCVDLNDIIKIDKIHTETYLQRHSGASALYLMQNKSAFQEESYYGPKIAYSTVKLEINVSNEYRLPNRIEEAWFSQRVHQKTQPSRSTCAKNYLNACDALILGVSEETILEHFASYMELAVDPKEQGSLLHKKLRLFCEHTCRLRFSREEAKQDSYGELCAILLQMMQHHDFFNKKLESHYQSQVRAMEGGYLSFGSSPWLRDWLEDLKPASLFLTHPKNIEKWEACDTTTLIKQNKSEVASKQNASRKRRKLKFSKTFEDRQVDRNPYTLPLLLQDLQKELLDILQDKKAEEQAVSHYKHQTELLKKNRYAFREQQKIYQSTDHTLENISQRKKKLSKGKITDFMTQVHSKKGKQLFKELEHSLYNLQEDLIQNQLRLQESAIRWPEDLQAYLSAKLRELSGKRRPLSMDKLIQLYANSNTAILDDYSLTVEAKCLLQKTLKAFLLTMSCYRQYKNLWHVLHEPATITQKPERLLEPLLALHQHDASIQAFEYKENMTLRPVQQNLLSTLLSQKDEVVQTIMGGGKSKVLLPLLAKIKPNGNNLVIIEVPDGLLNTTYQDLSQKIKHIYNHDVTLFHFDRTSASDPIALDRLLLQLKQTIEQKSCLMTTAHSLQSLKLKYRELLYLQKTQRKNKRLFHHESLQEKLFQQSLNESIDILQAILKLLKDKGELVIDEIHEVLDISHELNYAIDEPKPLDKVISETSLELFSYFSDKKIETEWDSLRPLQGKTLVDLLKEPGLVSQSSSCLSDLLHYYIDVLTNDESFLSVFFPSGTKTGELSFQEKSTRMKDYLLNKNDFLMDNETCLSTDLQKKLVILRQKFSIFLPYTLQKKLNVDYGRAQPPAKKGILEAIPYAANNKASTNVFENFMEAINYSIQMLYSDENSISFDGFKALIQRWKKEAEDHAIRSAINLEKDSFSPGERCYQRCMKAARMQTVGTGLQPEDEDIMRIDFNDEVQMERLYQSFKVTHIFKEEMLAQKILPSICFYPKKLSSNAMIMYRWYIM